MKCYDIWWRFIDMHALITVMKEETYVLNGWFNLWEQVDKLDVGWEYEAARGGTTKVVLGV